MWRKMINEIQKIEERYGGGLKVPASNQEINKMQENISVEFSGYTLPTEYVNFLKK